MRAAFLLAGVLSTVLWLSAPARSAEAEEQAQLPQPAVGTAVTPRRGAVRRLGESIDNALAGAQYAGFDPLQKRTLALLAVNAALIIETGKCADPSAPASAAESFLFMFAGIGRKAVQPIFALSAARKAELVDRAIELESQRTPDPELVELLCYGRLLPPSSIKPIAERRDMARQVLLLGLSPPTSEKPAGASGRESSPSAPASPTQSSVPK